MASLSSRFFIQLGFVVAIVLAGCAAQPGATVCPSGIICPAGSKCAAAQSICIINNCGNAIVDVGEGCDDGNVLSGDGCSPTCQVEKCGNHVLDPGEICDDGNTTANDGCSADCKSTEQCGNCVIDTAAGEVCDDCNTVGADGCSANCRSTEVCGNGIVDTEVGEVCDPPGAGCSPSCRSVLACGNGIIDPGEECDNGLANNTNNNDCRADCVINRCGDGYTNTLGTHTEGCDDAPPAAVNSRLAKPKETNGCNLDCTLAMCGDNKINKTATEQCDNGLANADNADCTAGCKLNVCGDNKKDTVGPVHIEPCDDGNLINNDGCTNSCSLPSCGNYVVDMGEQCDLGMANSDSGPCLANCLIARCGDGLTYVGVEQCDGGAGCSATCRFQICGNGILDPGEQCDDSNLTNNDGCSSTCRFEYCGDNVKNNVTEACDTAGNSQTCNLDCTTPMCGDGKVNHMFTPVGAPGTEQCDPPSVANGCNAKCQFEHCGNGTVDPGEQCDGAPVGGFMCAADCHLQKCGNGVLDPGEECDDNNASDTDDCISSNPAPAMCKRATCGDNHVDAFREQCDHGATNGMTGDTCSSTCRTVTCGNGTVEQGEQCDNGAGNNGLNKSCRANCQINVCGDGDVYTGVEQCDTSGVDTAACNGATCTLSVCGDGHKNTATGEACDHGTLNGTLGDTCDSFCKLNSCGNAIVEVGEECDPGTGSPAVDSATCNFDCTSAECGDNHRNSVAGEACDQGAANGTPCAYNNQNCTRCNATCTAMVSPGGPFCGDSVKQNGNEACDNGNANGAATCAYGTASCSGCSADCQTATSLTGNVCGDGVVDASHESCDDHNTNACGRCDATCHTVTTSQATGVIVAIAGSKLIDGQTFTLNDGRNGGKIFEFDNNATVGGGHIAVTFTATDSASVVAATMIVAIGAAAGLDITAMSAGGGLISLKDVFPTSLGNVAITETVVDPDFAVLGMLGGLGGNCGNGTGCNSNDDCTSHNCTAGNVCAP